MKTDSNADHSFQNMIRPTLVDSRCIYTLFLWTNKLSNSRFTIIPPSRINQFFFDYSSDLSVGEFNHKTSTGVSNLDKETFYHSYT